jgi:hypothetical protein
MVKAFRKEWTSLLELAVPTNFKRETPKSEGVLLRLIKEHIMSAYESGGAASCFLNLSAVTDG